METIGKYTDYISELLVAYAPKFILAIVVLILGLWVIKMINNTFGRLLDKRNVDTSLRGFLKSLVGIILKVMLFISVLTMVGVEMTSFIAILAAAGLAVGMALSGTLQNFAGGVMILLFKPFKAGDYIDAQGYAGTVADIQIFNTILKTPDNRTIIIPNGGLATSAMVNYSTEPKRRVDFTFGIGYDDDIDKARQIILDLIAKDERIHKDPAPFVMISELADSSVNFAVRVWSNAGDYWGIFFDMNEAVKKAFDKEGVSIPFPQTDVHLHQTK